VTELEDFSAPNSGASRLAVDPDAGRAGHSQRGAAVGGLVNFALAVVQISVGVLTNSQALIADGFHSLADLVGDVVVLSAARASHHPPDLDHPYGHYRFENAATMLLSALLFGAAAGITWRSLSLLQTGYGVSQVGAGALIVAISALFVKASLFRYLLGIARRVKSSMMEANAWHALSDAISSVVVVIGILGNLAGFTILDPIAAIIVAGLLCRMGWKFGHSAFDALTDRADVGQLAEIRTTLSVTPGVISVHQVRTRRSGDRIVGDAHVQVGPRLSVSDAHRIAAALEHNVLDKHGLADFVVHIDAERDGQEDHLDLPAREDILDTFRQVLPEGLHLLERSPLHFLDGKVEADLLVCARGPGAAALAAAFERDAKALTGRLPWLHEVRVFTGSEE